MRNPRRTVEGHMSASGAEIPTLTLSDRKLHPLKGATIVSGSMQHTTEMAPRARGLDGPGMEIQEGGLPSAKRASSFGVRRPKLTQPGSLSNSNKRLIGEETNRKGAQRSAPSARRGSSKAERVHGKLQAWTRATGRRTMAEAADTGDLLPQGGDS